MKIFLTLKSIPELSELPHIEQRLAWIRCKSKANPHWQTWAGTLLGITVGTGVGYEVFKLAVAFSPFGRRPTYFLAAFAWGVLIMGITLFLRNIVLRDQIRPYLEDYFEGKEK